MISLMRPCLLAVMARRRTFFQENSSIVCCHCWSNSAFALRCRCHSISKLVRPLPSELSILQAHIVAVLLPCLLSSVLFLSQPLCLGTLSCVSSLRLPSLCPSAPAATRLRLCTCVAVPRSNDVHPGHLAVMPNSSKFSHDMYTRFETGTCSSASNFSLNSLSITITSLLRHSPSSFGSSSFLRRGTAATISKLLRSHLSLTGFLQTILVNHTPSRFSTMNSAVVALTPS